MARYVARPLAASSYLSGHTTRALFHVVDAERPELGTLCPKIAPSSVLQDSALDREPKQATCRECKRRFNDKDLLARIRP